MVYDALGRCVKRSLTGGPTTYYIYDGEKPILEYDGGGGSAGVNLYGKGIDEIVMRIAIGADSNWWTYYPQQNHEGSVTLLSDGSGNVLERYRYDAFGAPTIYDQNWNVRSATIYDNRFLFTGREYAATYRSSYTNAALNFYEFRARAYNPKLGRFMSEDPKVFDAGDYNLFRYCHNDPIDFTDPMGTEQDFATIQPREVSRMRADDDSHRYITGADGKWHRCDGSGQQEGTSYNEMGRQVIAQGTNPPMPRIVMRAPPAVLTAGRAKGQGLADITNVHRLAQVIRPGPGRGRGDAAVLNVVDYGVAYPAAVSVALPVVVTGGAAAFRCSCRGVVGEACGAMGGAGHREHSFVWQKSAERGRDSDRRRTGTRN